jgi:hypothetical protein
MNHLLASSPSREFTTMEEIDFNLLLLTVLEIGK